MTAVLLKAMRDLRRRRLQAAVIFVTTLLAVGTGTMALTLIAQTRDPYQLAFEAQKGAHLKVAFDGRVDPATIAATRATAPLLAAHAQSPAAKWLVVLALYDAVFALLAYALFDFLLED